MKRVAPLLAMVFLVAASSFFYVQAQDDPTPPPPPEAPLGAPEGEKPAQPAAPEGEKPAQPAAPEGEKPAQPAAPEGEKPAQPAAPEGEKPAQPAAPEGEKPAQPAAPEGEKPAQPAAPEGEKPAQPAAPEGEKPAQPAAPEGEKPAPAPGKPAPGKPAPEKPVAPPADSSLKLKEGSATVERELQRAMKNKLPLRVKGKGGDDLSMWTQDTAILDDGATAFAEFGGSKVKLFEHTTFRVKSVGQESSTVEILGIELELARGTEIEAAFGSLNLTVNSGTVQCHNTGNMAQTLHLNWTDASGNTYSATLSFPPAPPGGGGGPQLTAAPGGQVSVPPTNNAPVTMQVQVTPPGGGPPSTVQLNVGPGQTLGQAAGLPPGASLGGLGGALQQRAQQQGGGGPGGGGPGGGGPGGGGPGGGGAGGGGTGGGTGGGGTGGGPPDTTNSQPPAGSPAQTGKTPDQLSSPS